MSNTNSSPAQTEDDEVTLKELVLKAREHYQEIKRNWKIVAVFVAVGLLVQGYRVLTFKKYYNATVTFMVNDAKGPSMGGVLGQLGGLMGDKEEKLDKILELARSRKMIGKALFQKGTINGKEDFYANHLIDIEEINDWWIEQNEDSILNGFVFKEDKIAKFTNVENSALQKVYKQIVGGENIKEPLYAASSNKKTGILTFSIKTRNEKLSLQLSEAFFQSLSQYYVESSTRKEQETYNILKTKKDSIERILNNNDVASAQREDQSNSLLYSMDKVPAKRYSRNNVILTALYGEIVKNSEMADYALKSSTPFVTIIDEPIPPLKPTKLKWIPSMLIGLLIGAFLGALFVIARKIYREALA